MNWATEWLMERDERRALERYRRTVLRARDLGSARPRDLADRNASMRQQREAGVRVGATPLTMSFLDDSATRALGLRVHVEQWVAVLALLDGAAVQLDTGEGKTLA